MLKTIGLAVSILTGHSIIDIYHLVYKTFNLFSKRVNRHWYCEFQENITATGSPRFYYRKGNQLFKCT